MGSNYKKEQIKKIAREICDGKCPFVGDTEKHEQAFCEWDIPASKLYNKGYRDGGELLNGVLDFVSGVIDGVSVAGKDAAPVIQALEGVAKAIIRIADQNDLEVEKWRNE